jgi:hypothetical protein
MTELSVAPEGCSFVEAPGWREPGGHQNGVVDGEGRPAAVRPDEVGVYACTLGGDDGRTLLLGTAPGVAEHERRDTRQARVLAVPVDVPAA